MKNIKINKDTASYKSGQILFVENNVAHQLIDSGVASLAGVNDYQDKMVGSQKSKNILKTK